MNGSRAQKSSSTARTGILRVGGARSMSCPGGPPAREVLRRAPRFAERRTPYLFEQGLRRRCGRSARSYENATILQTGLPIRASARVRTQDKVAKNPYRRYEVPRGQDSLAKERRGLSSWRNGTRTLSLKYGECKD